MFYVGQCRSVLFGGMISLAINIAIGRVVFELVVTGIGDRGYIVFYFGFFVRHLWFCGIVYILDCVYCIVAL